MAFQNNIVSFGETRVTASTFFLREEYRDAVNACRQQVAKAVPHFAEEMFEKLDDALYKLADKAESNQQQSMYFDAMRDVRKERKRIESGLKGGLLQSYDSFWQSGPASQAASGNEELESDDFSLVEEDALEQGLAISNMVSRGENRYYRDLYALNQRFGKMAGDVEIQIRQNPLGPAAFAGAFYDVTKGMGLDVQVKLVIYKQFEHEVIDALGRLYSELNELLAQRGVLPKLTRKPIRRPGGSAASRSEPTAAGADSQASSTYQDSNIQSELFSALQQLLSQRRPTPVATGSHLPVLASTDVVDTLSLLQQGHQVDGAAVTLPNAEALDLRAHLLHAIQASREGRQAGRISDNDEDAIDIISMLFEFVLEDKNLPDAMKALLARLQIPMLKVAILDRAFFKQKSHPARRLLNSMAQAAIGWSEGAGRADGGLHAKMESIVSRVLSGFDSNLDLFCELNDEFNTFLDKERQGTLVTEQRVAQVTQGKEQLESARHLVFEEINNRLFDRGSVPPVVATLLKDGWKDVLLLICLRKGSDSPEWRDAVALMDRLLWSVEPKQEKDQRQELLQEIPVLLKGLRVGLNSITYDQHKMARLFKDLQLCHVDCLKGRRVQAAPVVLRTLDTNLTVSASVNAADSTETAAVEEIVIASPGIPEPDQPVERDEYTELAENLVIGTWLEVDEAEREPYRAKLSWRSKMSGTCLFVNRKGMKVAEKSLHGLAAWLRGGKARLLQDTDVPLMDRAMLAMMNVLKENDPSAHNA